MRKIEIYAINHKCPERCQVLYGGISHEFICGQSDRIGDNIAHLETYADMRAPYWIWKNRDDLDIIGFQGYRKFLDFLSPHVPCLLGRCVVNSVLGIPELACSL